MNFSYMKDFMDRLTAWRIPGNSISVCLGGQEVFNYQSGYSDLENKIPMEKNKLFNIYSCSKVATVTAALTLYEKGYFLLDDPLYEFMPEFKEMLIEDENGNIKKAENHITIRHLFTMTSGLTYKFGTENIKNVHKLTDGKMNTLAVMKGIAKDPLAFEPGTAWRYSMSHDVLAGVVEVISGMKFRDYMKKNIFEPLGMENTYYHNDKIRDKMAEQYSFEVDEEQDIVKMQMSDNSSLGGRIVKIEKNARHVLGEEYDSGGAGITTSIEDYSKFVSALANGGVGANGERIIASGTIDLLRTNQLSDDLMKTFSRAQYLGYGYGLGVRTLVSKAKSGTTGNIGEFGWGGAAGSTVLVDPDIGLSVFYAHHMLNPQERYYQPRLRNVVYTCLKS